MIPRTLATGAVEILNRYDKMAFVSGPRQVGKTTFAKRLQKDFSQSLYFNWDVITDQKRLLKNPYFFESEDRDVAKPFLLVLDEIHKYARWKNYLKGAYDRYHPEFRFLVTGSGRLDLFKKGGDSLLGRYLGLPLFPLSVGEISGHRPSWNEFQENLQNPPPIKSETRAAYRTLFEFSGFPEPWTKGGLTFYNMWFQERKSLLVREDIRGASAIREISLLEALSHAIPDRVGAPLSINALKEDIGVAFETAREWLLLLEQFFYLFRLRPFSGSLSRSLKKEAKAYLYDWVEIPDAPIRFENMVALHLHKAVRTWRALGAGDLDLFYVRDKEKREVDFLITEKMRPLCLVECKSSDTSFAPALVYFQEKLQVPTAVQLVHSGDICRKTAHNGKTQWIISADRWLDILP